MHIRTKKIMKSGISIWMGIMVVFAFVQQPRQTFAVSCSQEKKLCSNVTSFAPEIYVEGQWDFPEGSVYRPKWSNVRIQAITKNSYASNYGFQSLQTTAEKQLYQQLEIAAEQFQNGNEDCITTISASSGKKNYYALALDLTDFSIDATGLGKAVVSFLYDHPVYFWSKGYSYFVDEDTNEIVKVCLQCQEDFADGKVRAGLREEIEQEIQGYMDKISGVTDDYEKELILHDALNQSVTYARNEQGQAEDTRWAHTIEGVFSSTYKKAVCEGYAKAFQLLMQAAGIPCVYVVGKTAQEGHAWNQVCIDKKWYNVDATWDDTGDQGVHKYFNLPDSTFLLNHFLLPASNELKVGNWCYDVNTCTSTEYSYSNQQGNVHSPKYIFGYGVVHDCNVQSFVENVEIVSGTSVAVGAEVSLEMVPTEPNQIQNLHVQINDDEKTIRWQPTDTVASCNFYLAKDTSVSIWSEKIDSLSTPTNATSQGDTSMRASPSASASTQDVVASSTSLALPSASVAPTGSGGITASQLETAVPTVTANPVTTSLPKSVKKTLKIVAKKKKVKVGNKIQLKTKTQGMKNTNITWHVSSKKYATINKKGWLYGKKAGFVNVIAKKNKITAKIRIKIVKK